MSADKPDSGRPDDDVVGERPDDVVSRPGDDVVSGPGGADPPTAATPPAGRRVSAGAQAASRARRIGGRPLPGARPGPGPSVPEAAAPSGTGDSGSDEPARLQRRGGMGAARVAASTRKSEAERLPPGSDAADGAPGRGARVRALLGRSGRLVWLPAAIAAVAVVALAALCVARSHGVWWAKSAQASGTETRTQVLAAAKTCAGAVVSYDYRNLAASKKAGVACLTGPFVGQYTKAMDTTVTSLAPKSKTVQTFQVAKAGVEKVSSDGKQWVVLVYGQQSVTNSTTAKGQPRLDVLSIQATLDKVGSTWKLSALQEVS